MNATRYIKSFLGKVVLDMMLKPPYGSIYEFDSSHPDSP